MERLPHETETLGEPLLREEGSRIEQLSLAQQDNRTKLITYKNVTAANAKPPYTLDRYGQLDLILINKKWKNDSR